MGLDKPVRRVIQVPQPAWVAPIKTEPKPVEEPAAVPVQKPEEVPAGV